MSVMSGDVCVEVGDRVVSELNELVRKVKSDYEVPPAYSWQIALKNHFSAYTNPHVLLVAPTGSGKTRALFEIMKRTNGITICTVDSVEVVRQIADKYCIFDSGAKVKTIVGSVYSDETEKTGRIWDEALRKEGNNMIVLTPAILYSALQKKHLDIERDGIGLIVIDEIHMAKGNSPLRLVCETHVKNAAVPVLGMTATPVVQKKKFKLKSVESAVEEVYRMQGLINGELIMARGREVKKPSIVVREVSEKDKGLIMLTREVLQEVKKVMIYIKERVECEKVCKMLREEYEGENIVVGYVMGNSTANHFNDDPILEKKTKKVIHSLLSPSKVAIVCCTQVLGQGIDAPLLNTLILYDRPATWSDAIQWHGRLRSGDIPRVYYMVGLGMEEEMIQFVSDVKRNGEMVDEALEVCRRETVKMERDARSVSAYFSGAGVAYKLIEETGAILTEHESVSKLSGMCRKLFRCQPLFAAVEDGRVSVEVPTLPGVYYGTGNKTVAKGRAALEACWAAYEAGMFDDHWSVHRRRVEDVHIPILNEKVDKKSEYGDFKGNGPWYGYRMTDIEEYLLLLRGEVPERVCAYVGLERYDGEVKYDRIYDVIALSSFLSFRNEKRQERIDKGLKEREAWMLDWCLMPLDVERVVEGQYQMYRVDGSYQYYEKVGENLYRSLRSKTKDGDGKEVEEELVHVIPYSDIRLRRKRGLFGQKLFSLHVAIASLSICPTLLHGDLSLCMEAATPKRADYQVNYEKLEFFGDSVLKGLTSTLVYGLYPAYCEDLLTVKRAELVSNVTLEKLAVALGYRSMVVTHSSGDVIARMITMIDVSARKKGKKMYSDIVESVLGLYTTTNLDFSQKDFIMKGLAALSSPTILPLLDLSGVTYSLFPESNIDLDGVEGSSTQYTWLEDMIGYRFNNIKLLEKAVQPPSHDRRHFIGYNRLEFLGDGLLDLVVAFAGYYDPQHGASQKTLHEFKKGLVNNMTLAMIFDEVGLVYYVDGDGMFKKGDIIESLIGAVGLDCKYDMQVVKEFILRLYETSFGESTLTGCYELILKSLQAPLSGIVLGYTFEALAEELNIFFDLYSYHSESELSMRCEGKKVIISCGEMTREVECPMEVKECDLEKKVIRYITDNYGKHTSSGLLVKKHLVGWDEEEDESSVEEGNVEEDSE